VREGKPVDKSLIYKLLNNRTYLGPISSQIAWSRLANRLSSIGSITAGAPRDGNNSGVGHVSTVGAGVFSQMRMSARGRVWPSRRDPDALCYYPQTHPPARTLTVPGGK